MLRALIPKSYARACAFTPEVDLPSATHSLIHRDVTIRFEFQYTNLFGDIVGHNLRCQTMKHLSDIFTTSRADGCVLLVAIAVHTPSSHNLRAPRPRSIYTIKTTKSEDSSVF